MSFLAKDSDGSGRIDGMSHVPFGLALGALLSVFAGGSAGAVYTVGLTICFIAFFLPEVYQEYSMRSQRKAYPFNPFKWSQNRHQDYALPTLAYSMVFWLFILPQR